MQLWNIVGILFYSKDLTKSKFLCYFNRLNDDFWKHDIKWLFMGGGGGGGGIRGDIVLH